MRRLPVGSLLIAGLAVAFVFTTCSSRRALGEANAERDRARSEELRLRADSAGWATAFAIEVEHGESLSSVVAAQDQRLRILAPAVDSLVRQVELLGGQVRTLSSMYLSAVGAIERADATAHFSMSNNTGNIPDSITGHVSDGLLEADVTATIDPPSVALPRYSVALELVTAVTETPDGRALFTARAGDPRVTIAHRETYWSPPAPVAYCSLGTRAKWGAGGATVGAAGGTLLGLWLGALP